MEFDKESLLEKIYDMQIDKLNEIIKEKSKDLNLEKVNIEEISEQNKYSVIDKLEENYSIKISEYSKEFYKQGFIDGVKLIMEYRLEKTEGVVDSVISFEELQAFFDARGIDMESLEETVLNNASFYGRIFAKSGGIKQGIEKVAKDYFDIDDLKPVAMNGINECKVNLLKLKMGKATENFFEGMACNYGR